MNRIYPNPTITKILSAVIAKNKSYDKDQHYQKEDFFSQVLPKVDNVKGKAKGVEVLPILADNYLAACQTILGAAETTNYIKYNPNSIMTWHTNSDLEGTRTYYSYTTGRAIFRYINDDGRIIDSYDDYGWTCRQFVISKEKPLWHTIWSEKTRYSFGFNNVAQK